MHLISNKGQWDPALLASTSAMHTTAVSQAVASLRGTPELLMQLPRMVACLDRDDNNLEQCG